jgi:hypothetical protein
MGASPFNRGDYVRFKTGCFKTHGHSLKPGEIGVVTKVVASGDDCPRYLEINGGPSLIHYSLFESAEPGLLERTFLLPKYIKSRLRY